MTFETLSRIAPHLAALCPVGDDHAASEVYAASLETRPAVAPWSEEQITAMEPLE